ncbi:MAG: nicotinate (nicotinamide) nucleotide adenylyltransferase [Phycisphaerales bacterium]|nr:nicotinate (nicotinamide) nucleotide adenylyltransferase [Phycisphaerales bacterium]
MTQLHPLILAPTDFEMGAVAAAVFKCGIHAEFATIGVGPGAVVRWSQRDPLASSQRSPRGRRVILAGLAGGLDPRHAVGSVHRASRIIACGAEHARPSAVYWVPAQSRDGVTIASVDRIYGRVEHKRLLHAKTGAALVEMESAAFAMLASARGWNWQVIRAVSDDAESALPGWIAKLLNDDGSMSRTGLIATALRPSRWRALLKIGTDAKFAAEALGGGLVELLCERGVASVPQATTRTLVFGGTFDPPHCHHRAIVAAAAKLLGCDSIIIVVAGQAPLRTDLAAASSADRLEMARLAFADLRDVEIDAREVNRAGASFTVDTLRELASERGLSRESLVLLIGGDQALQFEQWNEWRAIDNSLATIAVVARPPLDADSLRAKLGQKFSGLGADGPRWERAVLPLESLDCSASAVRARLRDGQPIGDLVCAEVESWIRQRGLYA